MIRGRPDSIDGLYPERLETFSFHDGRVAASFMVTALTTLIPLCVPFDHLPLIYQSKIISKQV